MICTACPPSPAPPTHFRAGEMKVFFDCFKSIISPPVRHVPEWQQSVRLFRCQTHTEGHPNRQLMAAQRSSSPFLRLEVIESAWIRHDQCVLESELAGIVNTGKLCDYNRPWPAVEVFAQNKSRREKMLIYGHIHRWARHSEQCLNIGSSP